MECDSPLTREPSEGRGLNYPFVDFESGGYLFIYLFGIVFRPTSKGKVGDFGSLPPRRTVSGSRLSETNILVVCTS